MYFSFESTLYVYHSSPPAVSLPKPSSESILSCFLSCCKRWWCLLASQVHCKPLSKQIDVKYSPALGFLASLIEIRCSTFISSHVQSTGYLTLVLLITYYNSDQSLATLLYFLGSKCHVKVRCPDCKEAAELADDFSFVKCSNCSFDMTYGEYVKYIAYKDSRYRDILSDYK